jgi:DNA primase
MRQTDDLSTLPPLPPAIRGRLLAHYEWVVDWLTERFIDAPLSAEYYPFGLGGEPMHTGAWRGPLPPAVAVRAVPVPDGTDVYPACHPDTLIWLISRGAVGVGSWTPTRTDANAVRYARFVLRQNPGADDQTLRAALKRLRAVLQTFGLDGIPLLEGRSAALFVPFADAPGYDEVREFLRGIVVRAAATAPNVLVPERKPHEAVAVGRIDVTVRSNAPGRFSHLPYTLLGPKLSMVTPVTWDEIDRVKIGSDEASIAVRLQKGDLFGQQAAALAKQRFTGLLAAAR